MKANIKVYIANLGKYNEGELVGEWVDLPVTEAELEAVYVRIKVGYFDEDGEYVAGYEEDGSFYEEIAIHDYESNINGFSIYEYENLDKLNELADDLYYKDLETIEAIIEATGCDLEEAIEKEEVHLYKNYSLGDVAKEVIENSYDIPQELIDYIDYDTWADDNLSNEYYEVDNGVIYIG